MKKILVFISVLALLAVPLTFCFQAAAETEPPSPYAILDPKAGTFSVWNETKKAYETDADITVQNNGTGLHFNDDGYCSEKALGFSDNKSEIVVTAKNGKTLTGGGDSFTLSLWLKQTASTYSTKENATTRHATDNYESLFGTVDTTGSMPAMCPDGVYYYLNLSSSVRVYTYTKYYVQTGRTNLSLSKTAGADWHFVTYVVTPSDIYVYEGGTLLYHLNGTRAMDITSGTTDMQVKDFCARLAEGITAANGSFYLRPGLYYGRNTDSLRLDGVKFYTGAMTAEEAAALYTKEAADKYVPKGWQITYDLGRGFGTATVTVDDLASVVAPSVTYDGYTFGGWFFDTALTVPFAVSDTVPKVTTLYAKWNPVSYRVVYELNGGTNPADAPTSFDPDHPVTLPANPQRDGYTFGGWYRAKELKGSVTGTYPEQYGDFTVYAAWIPDSFRVTYETDGGINNTENPAVITTDDGTVTLKPALKAGFVFDGWFTDTDRTVAVTEISAGKDLTLYAKFTPIAEEPANDEPGSKEDPADTDPTEPEKKKGCGAVIGFSAATLLLCAAGAGILLFSKKGKKGLTLLSLVLLCSLGITAAVPFAAVAETSDSGKEETHTVRRSAETKKTIKILTISNSFGDDQCAFVHQLADASGVNIIVANAYVGYCSIRKHVEQYESGAAVYAYRVNGKNQASNVTLKYILEADKWDFVTIHNGSENLPDPVPVEPYLYRLMNIVREYQPQAEFVYNVTWPYSTTSTHAILQGYYGGDRQKMFEQGNVAGAELAVEKAGFPYVNPTGYAFMNAFEKFGTAMYRDQLHSSEMGRYLHACVWFEFYTGLEPSADYLPEEPSVSGGSVPTEGQAKVLRQYAHEAIVESRKTRPTPSLCLGKEVHLVSAIRIEGNIRTEYKAGETFDYTSFKVFGIAEDGSESEIKDFTLSHTAALSADVTSVTVSYDGLNYLVPITVK